MAERMEYHGTTEAEPHVPGRPVRRSSWGAIFAGMFTALAIMLTLDLLALAIGLTAVNPGEANNPTNWGIGAAIWWVVAAWIGFFFGGMVAARMSGFPRAVDGTIHGIVTWAFTGMVMLLLLSSATGAIVGGALGLANVATQAAQTAVAVAPGETRQTFQGAVTASPNMGGDMMTESTAPAVTQQQARKAARTGAGIAWAAFIMLVVGAGVGAAGGYMGRPQHMLYTHTGATTTTAERRP